MLLTVCPIRYLDLLDILRYLTTAGEPTYKGLVNFNCFFYQWTSCSSILAIIQFRHSRIKGNSAFEGLRARRFDYIHAEFDENAD